MDVRHAYDSPCAGVLGNGGVAKNGRTSSPLLTSFLRANFYLALGMNLQFRHLNSIYVPLGLRCGPVRNCNRGCRDHLASTSFSTPEMSSSQSSSPQKKTSTSKFDNFRQADFVGIPYVPSRLGKGFVHILSTPELWKMLLSYRTQIVSQL